MFTENRCMDMNEMPKAEMHKDYMMKDNMSMMGGGCSQPLPGVVCPPVYECPQERCVNREIVHEVPHVIPVNTRIINHHIYKHSFTPCFTCCEENVCSNVYDHCGRPMC